jgi:hypothetical protein
MLTLALLHYNNHLEKYSILVIIIRRTYSVHAQLITFKTHYDFIKPVTDAMLYFKIVIRTSYTTLIYNYILYLMQI